MPLGDTIPDIVTTGNVYVSSIDVKATLFTHKKITDFEQKNDRSREFESPHDKVTVVLLQDFDHIIGKNRYVYEALKPTVVPRHVAERLQELGLLYIGGVDSLKLQKIRASPQNKTWIIKVPRE